MQQRTVQAELDAQKAQNREFAQIKKQLQDEARDAKQFAELVRAEANGTDISIPFWVKSC